MLKRNVLKMKERIIIRKQTIKTITKQNKELNYQLRLQLLEADQNTVVIRRERDERNRLDWSFIHVKIII